MTSELTYQNPEVGFFTAGQLAKMGLPGLPGTDRGIRDMAKREGWECVTVPGRGPGGVESKFKPPAKVLALIESRSELSTVLTANDSAAEAREVNTDGFVYLPYYDVRASAGHGAFVAHAQATRHYAYDREWLAQHVGVPPARLALIPVSGNSMEPVVHDGDMVMVDVGDTHVLREGVYVFGIEDALYVKRLFMRGSALVIESSNPDYPPVELSTLREQPTFRLLGRVVGVPTFIRL